MRINDIYQKYSSQLRGYIAKHIPSAAMADDMVQDVFYKFVVADSQDPIESVSSWLYRVAQNQIVDHSRKRKEEPMPYLKRDEGDDILEIALSELLSDEKNNPETELLRSMVWEELEDALQELPEEQRAVFELNEIQGIPFKDIAEATDTPVNTLIARKRYAVLHLRARLQSLYEEIGLI